MPRLSKEQFEALPARLRNGTGHPLKDALVMDDTDAFRFQSAKMASPPAIADDEAVPAGEELTLHTQIIAELRRRGWTFVYHDPTRRTGATLGCPDFIIYAAEGRVLNVECKTENGKLSADQEKFRDGVVAQGHSFFVVRSLKRFNQIADKIFI